MARDGFSPATVDRLAKRVGVKCSYPDCRKPTAGPDARGGVTNLGVAAHIAAASPGGARYDPRQTSEERRSIENGIWLCQAHAKLIDDDELTYPPSLLREWKETAEHMAALEARGFAVRRASPFPSVERKVPGLIAEMRADLQKHPLIREIIFLSRRHSYCPGSTPFFAYFYEDHEMLDALGTILVHAGAIYDVAFNDVPRFNFTEEFVDYLLGES
ncbi:hypothetical protein [Brevundimonas sp.]|uniref:hypothetical protein n=1 Tax=Brevundimonas sp. TaxID=1871086 RepID=UPI0035127E3C